MKKFLVILLLFVPIFISAQTIGKDTTIFASACENRIPYYLPYGYSTYGPYDSSGLYFVDTIFTTLDHSQWEVVSLHLTIYKLIPKYTHAFICANETYAFGDRLLDSTGTYTRTIIAPCDTIETLYLTVNPVFYHTIFEQICKGESYTGNGFTILANELQTAGTFYYKRHLFSSCYRCNCDSIVTLKLQVNPPKETTLYGEICRGETYEKNGFKENKEGIYRKKEFDINGCDSIVTLVLKVNDPYKDFTFNHEICEGNVYTANGFNIDTVPGTYTFIKDKFTDKGCPDTVTLNLTVLPNLKMSLSPLDEICGDTTNFPIKYNVDTGKIDSIFVYFGARERERGFEDFVVRNPAPNNKSIEIPLPQDVIPDNYSVTLYFEGRCGDATFTVNFTVLYPSSVMEQRWNDVIVLKNPAYNGKYDFSYIEWFVMVAGNWESIGKNYDKGTYIYTENTTLMKVGEAYRVCLIKKGEYHKICSCPLFPIQDIAYFVYPRVDSDVSVAVVSCCDKSIKVYSKEPIVEMDLWNVAGQMIQQKRYAEVNNMIKIDAEEGFYVIRLTNNKGQIHIQKVIVQ